MRVAPVPSLQDKHLDYKVTMPGKGQCTIYTWTLSPLETWQDMKNMMDDDLVIKPLDTTNLQPIMYL
jgi:hypothetical protein